MNKKAHSKRKKQVKAKSIKKKVSNGAKSTEVVYHSTKEIKVERALIENFIGLQRVMLNLANKFDNLSNQISKLLDLFEISAKSLARKELSVSGDIEARKVLEKLDNISKQAGLIGRGLALIHEVGTENDHITIPPSPQRNMMMQSPPVVPQVPSEIPAAEPSKKMTQELEGFERSATLKNSQAPKNER